MSDHTPQSAQFSLLRHYKFYPQLRLCSLLILLLGILGTGLHLYLSSLHQEESMERYGQLLANNTARQAVEATLSQDMVSLQSVLQETAQQPYVIGASIRNTKNQLIVQSGYKPNQYEQVKRASFSAAIALHNNVAGYLEVTLEMPRFTREDILFFILWCASLLLCLGIIGWSIQRRWWSSLRDKIPSSETVIQKVIDNIQQFPSLPEAEPEPEPAPLEATKEKVFLHCVRLDVHLLNLKKLYSQLDSENFQQVLSRAEPHIYKLIKLYNGANASLANDRLTVEFFSEDTQEATFRAICFGKLMADALELLPSPKLQMSGLVYLQQKILKQDLENVENSDINFHSAKLKHNFLAQQFNQAPEKSNIHIHSLLIDDTLKQMIDVNANTGQFESFKSPFSEYINQQKSLLGL